MSLILLLPGGGLTWHEDNLGVRGSSQSCKSIQISDLHSSTGVQLVRGFSHELSRVNISLSTDDLSFSDSLSGSGGGQVLLKILGELDFLDEHSGDGDTPVIRWLLDDLSNVDCDPLLSFKGFLKESVSENVSESGLGDFSDGLLNIFNGEEGSAGIFSSVVHDGINSDVDVILSHNALFLQIEDLLSSINQGQ